MVQCGVVDEKNAYVCCVSMSLRNEKEEEEEFQHGKTGSEKSDRPTEARHSFLTALRRERDER